MIQLYLYNNYHAGDQVFTRPLYRSLLASGMYEVCVGVYKNYLPIVEDLEEEGARIVASDYEDRLLNPEWDLRNDCPPGCVPITTWLGTYKDTLRHNWANLLRVFQRQLQNNHLPLPPLLEKPVPMVDFVPGPELPQIPSPWVFLDNSRTRSGQSDFIFDEEGLAQTFPDCHFLCTAKPSHPAPNLLDGSGLNLRELSLLSDSSIAILGKGSGPFCCTYTENNRFKARGICGYKSEAFEPLWDYEGNPLRFLDSMEEVSHFLQEALHYDLQTSPGLS